MKSNYKSISELVYRVDDRNNDGSIDKLVGLSIEKCFIDSVANTVGTNLNKYKIVRKNDFAVSLMQVSRDSKIPIARFDEDVAIMSPAYSIFRIKNNDVIIPEYMDMWFKRTEFDREAAFIAVGGVRGSMPWDEFARMKIMVPPLEEQKRIVDEYNVITKRIALKKKINECLESLLDAIFKKMFIEDNSIIFSKNKLYEIVDTIDNRGKTPPNGSTETQFPLLEIASLRTNGRIASYNNCSKYVSEDTYNNWFRNGHPRDKDILMSTVGSLAELKLFWGNKGSIAQNIVAFRCHNKYMPMYLYQYLLRKQHELAAYEIGSVQSSIKVSQVVEYDVSIPSEEMLKKFDKIATNITQKIFLNEVEMDLCYKLRTFRLQQLSA